jgi:hypothetical protein
MNMSGYCSIALCLLAAPAAAQPVTESQPMVVVPGDRVELQLESSRPDVTFMLQTRAAESRYSYAEGYDRICTAPCRAQLSLGTYRLALSRLDDGDTEWTSIDEAVRITGPGSLRAQYEDASGLRTAGYITLGAGGGVGALLVALGIGGGAFDNGEGFPIWSLVIGTAVTVVCLITGTVLALQDDDATVSFTPAARAPMI